MADTEVGSLVVKMKADLSDYMTKLDQMDKSTKATTSKMNTAFAGIASGVLKASAAIGTAALASVHSAMQWGTAVDDLGDKTGMAGEEASKLLVIAKRVGIGTEEASGMFAKFARSVYSAAEAQVTAAASGKQSDDAFTKLGITLTNTDGTLKGTSELFGEVKNKIAEMPDGLQKTATEMEVFGRSGTQMHDLLNMTNAEMQETINKAQQMGLILSTDSAAAWEKFERDTNSAKLSLASFGISVGTEVMPMVKEALNYVNGLAASFASLDPETKKNIMSIVKLGVEVGIFAVGAAKVGGIIATVATSLGMMRLATIAATGPWGALAVAIGLAIPQLREWNIEAQRQKEVKAGGKYVVVGNHTEFQSTADAQKNFMSSYSSDDYDTTTEGFNPYAGFEPEKSSQPVIVASPSAAEASAGSAEDTKTELESYLEKSSQLTQLWQSQVDLNEISRAGYKALLEERLEGLKLISAGEDELMDKEQAQKSLEVQIQSITQKIREEEMADSISAQTRITSAKKDSLSQQQEAERHNLQMSETFSLDEYEAKRENWANETAFKLQNIEEVYEAESESLNATIKLYEDLRAEKGTLTREENEQYKNYLEQKRSLDSKYALNREQIENSYAERVAAQQRQIINENNDMISSLILGTKSGHDILNDMWTDFVKQTVAKLWSINSETNIFSALLGGLFGGSSGTSSGAASGAFEWRANGGPVSANRPYIVGEKGPELFMPSYNGSIIPNSAITSGGALQSNGMVSNMSFNVNQTFNGQQDASVVAQIKASIPYIKSEIRDAIRNETAMRNAVKGAST